MRKPSEHAGRTPEAPLAEDQVLAYLAAHPDFLDRHAEELARLLPARRKGERVIDLQRYLVERMRQRAEDLEDERAHLISSARANVRSQARIHRAVLSLMGAAGFENLVQSATVDLPAFLGLDAASLCIEADDGVPAGSEAAGVRVLEPGTVDRLVGAGHDMHLRPHAPGDPAIFGPAASLVRSDALLRLRISSTLPEGLLALGSRKPRRFHQGQGTALLEFLARALESAVRGWLELPR